MYMYCIFSCRKNNRFISFLLYITINNQQQNYINTTMASMIARNLIKNLKNNNNVKNILHRGLATKIDLPFNGTPFNSFNERVAAVYEAYTTIQAQCVWLSKNTKISATTPHWLKKHFKKRMNFKPLGHISK